jgi:hypothetical protein
MITFEISENMNPMIKQLFILLCFCLAVMNGSAQKSKTTKKKASQSTELTTKKKSATPPAEAVQANSKQQNTSAKTDMVKTEPAKEAEKAPSGDEADLLFNEYRFDAAIQLLNNKVKLARKKKQSTALLEERIQKARIGQNMLQATEKVIFVDSFVVPKNDFLKTYRLSPSSGMLTTYGEVFPEDKDASSFLKSSPAYMNEFQDRLIYSYPDKQGNDKLFTCNKLGNKWSTPSELSELSDSDDFLSYPFLLSDGTTLYYAADNAGSLGGFDIYVTRYDTDTKQYLKPENIGMPFNSPANDYLYAVDEANKLGWFVSDRYQPADKVCIYVFIPTETREVYTPDGSNQDSIRALARISTIRMSQNSAQTVSDALNRLKNVQDGNLQKTKSADFYLVIANGKVYTDLNDFRSDKAKQLAQQWKTAAQQRTDLMQQLKQNRHQYAQGKKSLKTDILKQEKNLEQQDAAILSLENKIRKEEQSKLGIQ